MSRLTPILNKNFTEEQKRLFESIAGSKRGAGRAPESFLTREGAMRGPFNALIHSPGFGRAVEALGAAVRFEGVIDAPLRELAILIVAAKWRSSYEWQAHAKIALKAGLSSPVIESVRTEHVPDFENPGETVVYNFVKELINDQRVSDAHYRAAVDLFGEAGVVELVITAGHYTLISMILNTFEVPLPEGERPPFKQT
jgi:4-carboxymuconolactone decarboxylase